MFYLEWEIIQEIFFFFFFKFYSQEENNNNDNRLSLEQLLNLPNSKYNKSCNNTEKCNYLWFYFLL